MIGAVLVKPGETWSLTSQEEAEPCKVTKRQKGDVVIVDMRGEFTVAGGSSALGSQVKSVLVGGTRKMILNLAGIQMTDSSGIGELTAAQKAGTAVGATIKLLNVGAEVRRVLDLARVASAFEVFSNETAAVASFRP